MALEVQVVKDTTAPFVFRLKNGTTTVNLTGASVTLMLYDENGAAVSFLGTLIVSDAANGLVQFTPNGADFDSAPQTLYFRVKVTNGSQISFYPSAERAVFRVASA